MHGLKRASKLHSGLLPKGRGLDHRLSPGAGELRQEGGPRAPGPPEAPQTAPRVLAGPLAAAFAARENYCTNLNLSPELLRPVG